MLVVYFLTLYRLTTPATLGRLADLAGWDWGPRFFAPVTFLITCPIRWLPDALKLPALNCFAAVCAALTLALLARSVALLPHDRTNDQRLREQSEFSLLSIPAAWLPPLFAVLVCGLQLSFWERAVEFRDESFLDNGEIFNLLVFAYVARCLLEFRISRNESWLTRFALVYGLGIANNWAMIAFFPAFLAALIWIKGLEFFHWRFVARTLGLGLAGASLLFVYPVLNQLHHYSDYTFGGTLRIILSNFKLALFRLPPDKKWLLIFAVTSVVPVLFMGIRWGSSFGDNSPMGVALATFSFNLGHVFLLLCCLWVALDPPFSARELVGFVPYLPLYYLGALSVGYFSGYLLLVFGVRPARTRQRPTALAIWTGRLVVASVWLLAVAMPLFLVGKNLPQVQNGRAVAAAWNRFFTRAGKALPPKGAVILVDNDSRLMAFSLRAVLARSKPKPDDIFIETTSLGRSWDYVHVLDAKYQRAGILSAFTTINIPAPLASDSIHLLEMLAQGRDVYYLHPSFGYYFERFYPEDHGLVYRMNFYPTNAWTPPAPAPEVFAENRKFWDETSNDLQFVIHAVHSPVDPYPVDFGRKLEQYAHLLRETNQFAATLAAYYSRDLNYWGVELARSAAPQDTNVWSEAGRCFDLALQLNPDNRSARINLDFNRSTLAGNPPVYKKLEDFEDVLGGYRVWYDAINTGGPLDEPNFCRAFGVILRDGNNYRQAIQQFERLQALMPLDPSGSFQLAQTFLTMLNHPDALYYAYPTPLQTGLAATAAAEHAVRIDPNDPNTLKLKALAYWQLGLYLQAHTNLTDAACPSFTEAYSNGLSAINRWLDITPDEPNALFFKSMSLMQLGHYDQALTPLSTLIAQTNNSVAVLNRAICYFHIGTFDAAKTDYLEVKKTHPEAYQADYGLAEIAYRQKDITNAIKYYGSYESNAPPAMQSSDEYKGVQARLKELKAGSP